MKKSRRARLDSVDADWAGIASSDMIGGGEVAVDLIMIPFEQGIPLASLRGTMNPWFGIPISQGHAKWHL